MLVEKKFNGQLTSHAKNIATPLRRYALDLFIPTVSRNLQKKREKRS